MANQSTTTTSRGRSATEDDADDAGDTGRANGRGAAGHTEAASRGGQNSHGGRSNGSSASNGSQQPGGALPAAQKRVMNRAVRVLNEIETRIHELREELEEKFGGDAPPAAGTRRAAGSSAGGKSRAGEADHDEEDGDSQAHGQGRVKNPETDGRLKQNRDGGHDDDEPAGRRPAAAGRGQKDDHDDDTQASGQGRVKNPATDRRLKGNQSDD